MRPKKGASRVKQFFRNALVRLEGWLEKLGTARSSLVMSGVSVLALLSVHLILRLIEGGPITRTATLNIMVEGFAVAAPLILYSRRVRARLQRMTLRMATAAEEAREASRAKSAFLANMSHELRTPLNAILGFSEIMKDQHLGPISNPRYLSYSADIHTSGRHLLGIINDILDLAKIESGKMSLETAEEFALVPALSSALAILNGLGEKHGVTVRGQWDDEKIRLFAVERMVRQIVINVVGNAIKFTPQGGSVILTGALQADGSYVLEARDTGIGMNEGEMVNALTPFGQNRARMAMRQEGTGLGLPLAKAMIELHGGSLILESQPNRGTCVTLHFPAERVAPAREQQAA
jgi:signal transduction histidine kinase